MNIIRLLIGQLPVLLVFVGGAIIALLRWQRHPGASMLVIIAMALGASITVAFPMVYSFIFPRLLQSHQDLVIFSVTLASGLLHALVFVLLLLAVFTDRNQPMPTHGKPPQGG